MFALAVLRLSDSQMTMLFDAARPIAVAARDAFLHHVAAMLIGRNSVTGPEAKSVFRKAIEFQGGPNC